MRVVVTGGAGFIGSSLCHLLSSSGHEVVAFDNLMYDHGTLVSPVFTSRQYWSRPTLHVEDVTQWSDTLKRELDRADVVVGLSALVGAGLCDKHPEEAIAVNSLWFRELLNHINKQLIVFPNSNSGYGSYPGVCTEDTPTNPLSLYAKTKQDAEEVLLKFHDNTVAFRLATVYGSSFRTRTDLLVNNLVKTAVQERHIDVFDGHFNRNYVHISDVCNGIKFAINNCDKMRGKVYNLGNDAVNMTKLDLVKRVCEKTGASYSINNSRTDGDLRNYRVSSSRLQQAGFEASYGLDHGIEEMMSFYKMFSQCDDARCRNY